MFHMEVCPDELTQSEVTREEGISIEKLPKSDWSVAMSVMPSVGSTMPRQASKLAEP